jgi:hypothetical protein
MRIDAMCLPLQGMFVPRITLLPGARRILIRRTCVKPARVSQPAISSN